MICALKGCHSGKLSLKGCYTSGSLFLGRLHACKDIDSGRLRFISHKNPKLYSTSCNRDAAKLKNDILNQRRISDEEYKQLLNEIPTAHYDSQKVAKSIYFAMILAKESGVPICADEICKYLEEQRSSCNPEHQIVLLDIHYALHLWGFTHLYSQCLQSYVEYLKLQAPNLALQCLHPPESPQCESFKLTLSKLGVDHFSGVTGHFYSPIILRNRNLVIEPLEESEMLYNTDVPSPVANLRLRSLNCLGWRARHLDLKKWKSLPEEQKATFASAFISQFIADSQFIKLPAAHGDGSDVASV